MLYCKYFDDIRSSLLYFRRRLFGRLPNSFHCFRPLFAYSTTCNSLSDSTSLAFLMRLKRKYQMLSSRGFFSAVMTTTTSKLKLETLLFRHSEHKFFSCWPRRLLAVFFYLRIFMLCVVTEETTFLQHLGTKRTTPSHIATLSQAKTTNKMQETLCHVLYLINDSYDFLQLFTTRIHVIQSRVQLR